MLQRLLSTDPLFRLEIQQLLQQVRKNGHFLLGYIPVKPFQLFGIHIPDSRLQFINQRPRSLGDTRVDIFTNSRLHNRNRRVVFWIGSFIFKSPASSFPGRRPPWMAPGVCPVPYTCVVDTHWDRHQMTRRVSFQFESQKAYTLTPKGRRIFRLYLPKATPGTGNGLVFH